MYPNLVNVWTGKVKNLTIFMVNWTKTCHRVLIMSQVRLEAAAGSVLSAEMVNVHSNQIAKHSKSKDRVKNLYTCTNMSQLPSTQNFTSHMSYAHIKSWNQFGPRCFRPKSMVEGPNRPTTFQQANPPTFWRIRPFSRFRFSFAPHLYFQTLNNAMSPKEHPLATPRGFHVPKLEVSPTYEDRRD